MSRTQIALSLFLRRLRTCARPHTCRRTSAFHRRSPRCGGEAVARGNILRRAGVAADADGLLTFFRGRTLGDTECKQIGKLVHQLSARKLRRPAKTLPGRCGKSAAAADAAVAGGEARRRRGNRQKGRTPFERDRAAAPAFRPWRRRSCWPAAAPADAVPVLLAYLPFAADGAVEDEVLTALLALTPDGKADPALTAALTDPLPIKLRRSPLTSWAAKGTRPARTRCW